MKKTMTFLVLTVFASAILVGCGQTEGDPTVSTPAVSDSKEGTMTPTPAGEPSTPATSEAAPATSDSAPATSDSAAPTTSTSGGN